VAERFAQIVCCGCPQQEVTPGVSGLGIKSPAEQAAACCDEMKRAANSSESSLQRTEGNSTV
jgi:hypothetical protein